MTKQLITISDNAAKRIKEILSNAESGVKGVRVSVKSGGCAGMEYEMTYLKEAIPNDEVVKDNNVEVFIDPKAIMYLLGTKMDYKEDKFSSLAGVGRFPMRVKCATLSWHTLKAALDDEKKPINSEIID